ncbi:MAG: diguanylate cyclase [Anaerolineales bacterium]
MEKITRSKKSINLLRYSLLTFILLAILIGEFTHYRSDHQLFLHVTYVLIASITVIIIIEVSFREINRLQDQLEKQLALSEKRIQNQRTLVELSSRAVMLHDEKQIIKAVLDLMQNQLGYQQASITLQTQNEQQLNPVTRSNLLGRVRAPLRVATDHLGYLEVSNKTAQPFTTEEMGIIYAVANIAAVALRNAYLFRAQQDRQQEAEIRQRDLVVREQSLSLLNQITRQALQARGFKPMLETITGQICQLFSADTCLTALWDAAQKTPILQMAHGYQADWLMSTEFQPSMRVISSALVNSPRVIPINEPNLSPWLNPRLINRIESQSILALPLIANEDKLGVILISYRDKHAFTPVELAFGEQAASQIALAISKEYALDIAQHRAKELGALQKATAALLTTLELDALLGQILDAAMSAIPAAEKGVLHLVVPETGQLQLRATQGEEDPRIQLFKPTSKDSYAARSVRNRQPILVDNIDMDSTRPSDLDFPGTPRIVSIIVAPLHTEERVFGAIVLGSSMEFAFQSNDLQLLVSFAATATTALQNAQLHAAVQQQAVTDPLTGLYNRRGFFELAEHEIIRAHRFQRPLSMIIMDVDLLKYVNDHYGHLMGDRVLSSVSSSCRSELRQVDVIARYGGDEFIALLPETNLDEALSVAERLRSQVANLSLPLENGEIIRVTLTAGVADLLPGDTLKTLIERADQALYRAKQAGKNRVLAWN